jgi:peptide/nickel transport system permease protein
MGRFLLRRLLMLLASLLVASFVIYVALDLAPGSPIAALTGGRALPATTVHLLERQYHLNEPLLPRYVHWLKAALHGDLGYSIAPREPVSDLIGQRIGITAELVLYTSILIAVGGIGLGVLSALRPGVIDTVTLVGVTVLAALPSFVAAILLITVFAVDLHWFPALGDGSGLGGVIRHLTLPALALATSSLSLVARVTRTSVRGEMGREHVQTAVSRGLPARLVVRRHVLRNAAIPIATVAGLTIASLFALSAIVETAFNLNGIGAALVKAAADKDFAVVQGISLVLVAAFVLANALVDLLYAMLDPRVALGTAAD